MDKKQLIFWRQHLRAFGKIKPPSHGQQPWFSLDLSFRHERPLPSFHDTVHGPLFCSTQNRYVFPSRSGKQVLSFIIKTSLLMLRQAEFLFPLVFEFLGCGWGSLEGSNESLRASSSDLIIWNSSFFLITQDIEQIINPSTLAKMFFLPGSSGWKLKLFLAIVWLWNGRHHHQFQNNFYSVRNIGSIFILKIGL